MKTTYAMKNIIILTIIAITVILISNGCKKKDVGTPGTNEIWLQNTSFTPSQKIISTGTAITFTNKDNMTHTVSETTNLFISSGDMKLNDTFVITFSTAGIYHLYCKYHSSMTGTITVQ